MNIKKIIKKSFYIIGKEGSTNEGDGFIGRLWDEANNHFNEIDALVEKDENGNPLGIWGAMSDFSHSFNPWDDNFSKGLYLAGAKCSDESVPPAGWTKWRIPSFEYIYIENDGELAFSKGISYLNEQNIMLAGAVQELYHINPAAKHLYFPIRRL